MLGVTVDPKGEHAIHALLHLRDDSTLLQKDVQEQCGSSKFSIQKYRKLLQQLHDLQTTTPVPQQPATEQRPIEQPATAPASQQPATEQQEQPIEQPVTAPAPQQPATEQQQPIEQPATAPMPSTRPPATPQPIIGRGWLQKNEPSISALSVVKVTALADATYQRVLRATITLPSGIIERDVQVLFDASSGAAEANWKREAAAVRTLAAECGPRSRLRLLVWKASARLLEEVASTTSGRTAAATGASAIGCGYPSSRLRATSHPLLP